MTTYDPPKHGDRTHKGIWFDSRPINETSTLDEMLASAHTPDCDIQGCIYNALNFTLQERTWGELTYDGVEGLWLCSTHLAEAQAERPPYEPPRLTRLFDHIQLTTPA